MLEAVRRDAQSRPDRDQQTQSFVSYAEANHVKLIHAQDTAKVAKVKPTAPCHT